MTCYTNDEDNAFIILHNPNKVETIKAKDEMFGLILPSWLRRRASLGGNYWLGH